MGTYYYPPCILPYLQVLHGFKQHLEGKVGLLRERSGTSTPWFESEGLSGSQRMSSLRKVPMGPRSCFLGNALLHRIDVRFQIGLLYLVQKSVANLLVYKTCEKNSICELKTPSLLRPQGLTEVPQSPAVMRFIRNDLVPRMHVRF